VLFKDVLYGYDLWMASLHKYADSPYWICAYAAGGKRHFKSTKTKDRRQAETICRKWELAGIKAKSGKLTPDAAREVIAAGVAEIFAAGGDELPTATTRLWAERWLESKALESAPTTLERYRGIVDKFLVYLGKKADKDIEHVTSSDVEGFRNQEANNLTKSSGNVALKIVRALFSGAVAKQYILRNPASATFVKPLEKADGEAERRPLTLAEIKSIIDKTEPKSEWRGMILLGIYTGQRLGDIRRMTWNSVDLENDTISLTTQKTRKRIILPLAKPLRAYLELIPSVDDPNAPLFREASRAKKVGHLSNAFHGIMQEAGLVEARKASHKSTGKGRATRREVNELSFHSLRHSAVTFLKASGASDVFAREIVGHSSAAISRHYTHLATEDLRPAIDNLPDVTK
jgi:integrase